MNRLHTNTLYYLAQVYAALKDVRASKYCHLTLVHQLLSRSEFDKKTWALNAVQLSGYYSSLREYGRSLHCINAGKAMMPPEPKTEETIGTVHWAYGRFYLGRLRHYSNRPEFSPGVDALGTWWVSFPVGVEDPKELPPVDSFDRAREEFKEANFHFNEALKYFVMDGCCTDHIQILRDISDAYKYLVLFEDDRERQAAMHQRRASILEKIPAELNPQAYLTLIRQLLYDIAEIRSDILDVRLKQRSSAQKGLSDKKCNELSLQTLNSFLAFLTSFNDPKTSLLPAKVDDELRVPIFRAMMRIAGLQTKGFFAKPKDEYEAIGRSLEWYDNVDKFAKSNVMPAAEVGEEMTLVAQMRELLPGKQKNIFRSFNS